MIFHNIKFCHFAFVFFPVVIGLEGFFLINWDAFPDLGGKVRGVMSCKCRLRHFSMKSHPFTITPDGSIRIRF